MNAWSDRFIGISQILQKIIPSWQVSIIFYVYNINPLLHRYSFWCINTQQLLKTLWEKDKLLVRSNFSFFPQCLLLNQITVSPFVHIFYIISLFAAELEDLKTGIWDKGLRNCSPTFFVWGSHSLYLRVVNITETRCLFVKQYGTCSLKLVLI